MSGITGRSAALNGRLAELKAQTALVERGYQVAVPLVESTADLVIFEPHFLRIQVKSTRSVDQFLIWSVALWTRTGRRRRTLADIKADVFLIDTPGGWWVIPTTAIPAQTPGRISLGAFRYGAFYEAWHILDRPAFR